MATCRFCIAALRGFMIALLMHVSVQAQGFPSGDVRILVGYEPGGGTDITARLFGARLQTQLGVNVIVENRAGALGQIAAQFVSRQPPNGRTLLFATSSGLLAGPHLQPQGSVNPMRELAAISLLTRFPGVLVVHVSSNFRSVEDIVAEAKRNPGKLTYATSGNGSMNHLAGEMLNRMAGIDMIHVPYKGSSPALTALMGKHVDIAFAAIQGVMPRVRNGELRALGVDGTERSPVLPDVRAIREAGFSEYGIANWMGVFGPPQLPAELAMQIRNAFSEALKSAELRKVLVNDGQSIVGSTPAELQQEVAREYERIGTLVRSLNLGK
jgi:tripartite-type tricarboxylate transporter receptor subunit TctC